MKKYRITDIHKLDAYSEDPVVGLVGTVAHVEPSNIKENTEGWVACFFDVIGHNPFDDNGETYFFAVKLEEVTE